MSLPMIVEHLFVFEGNGVVRDFNGTYNEYRTLQKEEERERKRAESSKEKKSSEKVKHQYQQELTPGLDYEQRKEFKRLEKQIEKLEEKKITLTDKFNDPSLSPEDIEKYSNELGELQEALELKELRWMELAEKA